jgi:hypothetical protein
MNTTGNLKALQLMLLFDVPFYIKFAETEFSITYLGSQILIKIDDENYAKLEIENHQVSYKATILGGYNVKETKKGICNYKDYVRIDWQSDNENPEIKFLRFPDEVYRSYHKGGKVELGIENVSGYKAAYGDGTTANFIKRTNAAFDFEFSTGLEGSIWKDGDGTHTIKFKGVRQEADEDGYQSESKFIISRSKYTDNLILILQESAAVYLIP